MRVQPSHSFSYFHKFFQLLSIVHARGQVESRFGGAQEDSTAAKCANGTQFWDRHVRMRRTGASGARAKGHQPLYFHVLACRWVPSGARSCCAVVVTWEDQGESMKTRVAINA